MEVRESASRDGRHRPTGPLQSPPRFRALLPAFAFALPCHSSAVSGEGTAGSAPLTGTESFILQMAAQTGRLSRVCRGGWRWGWGSWASPLRSEKS